MPFLVLSSLLFGFFGLVDRVLLDGVEGFDFTFSEDGVGFSLILSRSFIFFLSFFSGDGVFDGSSEESENMLSLRVLFFSENKKINEAFLLGQVKI